MRLIFKPASVAALATLAMCLSAVSTVGCGDDGNAANPLGMAGAAGVVAGANANAGIAGNVTVPAAGSGTNATAGTSIGSAGAGANAGVTAGTRAATAGASGAPIVAGMGGSPASGGAGASGASAGVSGSAGKAGSAAAGSGGSATASGPACKGMPNQGVIIGDSYINWPSHTLPADLAREAGETWRLYAVGGASLQAGGIVPQFVSDQFEQAVSEGADIKLLVMDGGGNDVLLADTLKYPGSDACTSSGSSRLAICKMVVADTIAAFGKLIARAADVGVQNIVYFFYPAVPNGTALGGPMPNEIADYARPMWKAACDGAEAKVNGKLKCHFVDMVPVFMGHEDWFALADIHPNPDGSAAMAKAIVAKMKEDCVWQPAGSACCH